MKMFDNCSKSRPFAWLMASLLAALVAGCGGDGGGGGAAPAAAPPGTLGVSLTDSPACGFDNVYVTVVKVRVHQSSSASDTDAGWTDITLNPARKIDLLSLTNGALNSLGQTPLSPGHYTQLRLVLDPNTAVGLTNSVVPTGGVETALVTPSAVQSGIKLVNEFDVVSGQRIDLLLDFDACKSIVTRGNGTYALKPVIKVIPFVLNGIDGFVDLASLGSGVMVTAQQNGVIVQSTAPNPTTGEFFVGRLAPGNYDVVVTANGHATAVIATVAVATATSVTILSTSAAPLTLPVSATHTISGTETLSPPSSTTIAYVTAKQSFATPATVTTKFVAADDLSPFGYSLSLPIGAPMLGQFSATLPIALVAQAGVAGKYTVEATASGYQTQSVIKDISAADATQDFSLAAGLVPVGLGTAGNFAILTKAGITDVPSSVITGNIGSSPITGAAIGVTCAEVTGTIYSVDAAGPSCKTTDAILLTTAVSNMETAYTDAAGRPAGVGPFLNVGAGTVANQTLVPGVYTWGSAVTITTDLTLSGGPNDVWIFQITGTLDIAAAKNVILTGGALAKNIFWQVSDVATLGAGSHFEGVILAKTTIALVTGASINGRLLAQTAVTLQSNTVTAPAP
jgi:hypothetical protein